MPNNTSNILKKNGNFNFVETITPYMTDGDLDFQKIHPMPQELVGTVSPSTVVPDEEYDTLKQAEPHKNLIKKSVSDDLIGKYGHNNWYDWCVENWDTKWNSYNSNESLCEDGISFHTAWSPPIKVIQKLAEITGKSFKLFFAGEGGEFFGFGEIYPNEKKSFIQDFTEDNAPDDLKEMFGYEEYEETDEDEE